MNEIGNLDDFSIKQSGAKIFASSLMAGMLGYYEAKVALKQAKSAREQKYAEINLQNKAKEIEQIRAHKHRLIETMAGKGETEEQKQEAAIKIYDRQIKNGRSPRIAAMLAGFDYPCLLYTSPSPRDS